MRTGVVRVLGTRRAGPSSPSEGRDACAQAVGRRGPVYPDRMESTPLGLSLFAAEFDRRPFRSRTSLQMARIRHLERLEQAFRFALADFAEKRQPVGEALQALDGIGALVERMRRECVAIDAARQAERAGREAAGVGQGSSPKGRDAQRLDAQHAEPDRR